MLNHNLTEKTSATTLLAWHGTRRLLTTNLVHWPAFLEYAPSVKCYFMGRFVGTERAGLNCTSRVANACNSTYTARPLCSGIGPWRYRNEPNDKTDRVGPGGSTGNGAHQRGGSGLCDCQGNAGRN